MGEYNNVTIEKENGDVVEYQVVAIFDVGGNSYVALLPLNEDNEITFFGCNENGENKELELFSIDNEDEFRSVSSIFVGLMDEYASKNVDKRK